MNWLKKIIFQLRLKSITSKDILEWKSTRNQIMLNFALKKSNYRERILVIKTIRELRILELLPELLKTAKNDIEIVSKEAIETIKYLDIQKAHISEIIKFEEMWKIRNKPSKFRIKSPKLISRKERMQMLENVKRQLRKPMR